MTRYFASIQYNGTAYNGWQKQPNGLGIQQVLEKAVFTLLRQKIVVTGAGRTDTGVHALYLAVHFDIGYLPFSISQFCYKLNALLPQDVAVLEVVQVPDTDNAHARFDAIGRHYIYRFHHQKSPFLYKRSYFLPKKPDYKKMELCAKHLLHYSDFAAFCKANHDAENTICKITEACFKYYTEHQVVFNIKANRFLRNMVRAIVGTLLEVGQGKITPEQFEKIIQSGNRQNAGSSVPAHGLYLVNVEYSKKYLSQPNIDGFLC